MFSASCVWIVFSSLTLSSQTAWPLHPHWSVYPQHHCRANAFHSALSTFQLSESTNQEKFVVYITQWSKFREIYYLTFLKWLTAEGRSWTITRANWLARAWQNKGRLITQDWFTVRLCFFYRISLNVSSEEWWRYIRISTIIEILYHVTWHPHDNY